MPFQNLRVNSQFYILHKDGTPYVEVGAIAGVSNPVPDGTQPVMFGQPMKMVVDITVKVGEQTVTFQKIPAGRTSPTRISPEAGTWSYPDQGSR